MVAPRIGTLAKWSAFAAAGPITGPLVAGAVRNLRGGAPILATLYAVAWALLYLDLLGLGGHTAGKLIG